MFEISQHKSIVTDLPLIVDNYLEIVADENPILYTGNNKYGNRILGAIIEEDDDYTLYYFHIIIDDTTYYNFIEKRISLKHILNTAAAVFIISKKGHDIVDYNIISLGEIPQDYLPLDNSFCPGLTFIPSLNFGISLKGKKADQHLVEIPDANSIQTNFGEVLRNALATLDDLELKPVCLLEPAATGSFRVNYRIEFQQDQASLFHVDDALLANYLRLLLNFIVEKLPNANYTLKQDNLDSPDFAAVEQVLEQIFETSHLGIPDAKTVKEALVENINEAASKFEQVSNQIKNSNSFDRIELITYQADGGEMGLGVIDATFYDSIKDKLDIPDPVVDTTVITEDLTPQPYRIRVYYLNTDSGNCRAFYYPDINSEHNYKITIHIRKNDREYHNTILSKSLDEKKVVQVNAYGEREDGTVTSITIDL